MTRTLPSKGAAAQKKVSAPFALPPVFPFGRPTLPIRSRTRAPQIPTSNAAFISPIQLSKESEAPQSTTRLCFDFTSPSPPEVFASRSSSSASSATGTMSSDNKEEELSESSKPPQKQESKRTLSPMKAFNQNPQEEEELLLKTHLSLLQSGTKLRDRQEVTGTPLFTHAVQKYAPNQFSQYGFFAGLSDVLDQMGEGVDSATLATTPDPRLFFNIAAPSSAFICGSQGSGKSHTLSCLLENCLMKSDVSKLEHPLAGLVFHYDTFTSDERGTPCEAAYLASNAGIQVRVLCSPTNYRTIQRNYESLNVTVKPLEIDESNLNTKRMLDLMAVNRDDGPMPLYLHEITRILKEIRLQQQETNVPFSYATFKEEVDRSAMTPAQKMPLTQRLDTLESFMPKSQTAAVSVYGKNRMNKKKAVGGNDWTVKPGQLTIVDLSCPCVTSEGACSLFNMCLSLFLEPKTATGRVVALDEAHKYMNSTPEAASLTETLLSSIRLQRHIGTRVFISTQEPTISPSLLDLCSITIVHRFSSPEWLLCLKSHLAALAHDEGNGGMGAKGIFGDIVRLRVGEALVFAPSAVVGLAEEKLGEKERELVRLGTGFLRIMVRARITEDGGKSVMAS